MSCSSLTAMVAGETTGAVDLAETLGGPGAGIAGGEGVVGAIFGETNASGVSLLVVLLLLLRLVLLPVVLVFFLGGGGAAMLGGLISVF